MRAAYRDHGTPFPGARSDDKTYYGAYRSTLVVASGTGRFKSTEQEQRSDAARAVKRGAKDLLPAILFGVESRRSVKELAEIKHLSKQTGLSMTECRDALLIQRTSGIPAEDTLNHMKCRAIGQRIEAAYRADLAERSAAKHELTSDDKAARRGYGFVDLMPKEIQ
jgi:hypothetical protein